MKRFEELFVELKAKAARVICNHKEHIVKYILENIIEN